MAVTLNIARKASKMQEHLSFGEHLHEAPHDNAIRETFLGQAHIAGTGPAGATCRECVYWRIIQHKRNARGGFDEVVKPPAYHGRKHTKNPCELKKQRCTRPILNKAKRLIPHFAKACRLFERNENAPDAVKQDQKH